ncbi:hypothetical protein I4F81_011544 [Pyropia yezoensis]|uniref:Uncharacterized protein n=1 Tax=Pyropia yezoensis TaxID=2788 RepID=A0ACC3CFU4_PYRYE|nr:hypothetical protein I4F81_011544 [Neopyropia yezoensis]
MATAAARQVHLHGEGGGVRRPPGSGTQRADQRPQRHVVRRVQPQSWRRRRRRGCGRLDAVPRRRHRRRSRRLRGSRGNRPRQLPHQQPHRRAAGRRPPHQTPPQHPRRRRPHNPRVGGGHPRRAAGAVGGRRGKDVGHGHRVGSRGGLPRGGGRGRVFFGAPGGGGGDGRRNGGQAGAHRGRDGGGGGGEACPQPGASKGVGEERLGSGGRNLDGGKVGGWTTAVVASGVGGGGSGGEEARQHVRCAIHRAPQGSGAHRHCARVEGAAAAAASAPVGAIGGPQRVAQRDRRRRSHRR